MTQSAPFRIILPLCLLCMMACALTGCSQKQSQSPSGYDITLHSDFSDRDSAQIELFAVDTVYSSLRKLGDCTLRRGDAVRFQGKTLQDEQLAFFRLHSDTIPYYFILDSWPADIYLNRNVIAIRGGNRHFHEYVKVRNIVSHQLNLRSAIRHDYLRQVSDTTLTADSEHALIAQYSALEDSIHSLVEHGLASSSQPKRYLVMRKLGQYAPKTPAE